MIPVRICGTSSFLPGRPRSTAEMAAQVGRNPAAVERKTGIRFRYLMDDDDPATCAQLGARALTAALAMAKMPATELRRIIFVSSTGGDQLVPATANKVAALLGLRGSCDGFDLNNACMGFLTGFDLAARSVATGTGPTAIVIVETGNRERLATPAEPRPFLVMGEGVAAVVLDSPKSGEGLLATHLSNDGTLPSGLVLPHPIRTGKPARFDFPLTNRDVAIAALAGLLHATENLVRDSGLALADIDWVLPHQPNGTMFREIVEALGIDPARTIPVAEEIGSVASACIPISLDRLLRTRKVRAGSKILMLGIGSGVSRGALLYQVGTDGIAAPPQAPC